MVEITDLGRGKYAISDLSTSGKPQMDPAFPAQGKLQAAHLGSQSDVPDKSEATYNGPGYAGR